MSDLDNKCPQCREVLTLETKGDYDTWACPQGHGIGLTLTESWGHLQDDEIHAIWSAAKSGTPSTLTSPALGAPMVDVVVTVDDDEIEGNVGGGARSVGLSVAPDEQFLWFPGSDLSEMPGDLENAKPSAEEDAKLAQIRSEFGERIYAAFEKNENRGISGRFNQLAERLAGSEQGAKANSALSSVLRRLHH